MPETAQEIKETEVLYSEGATPLFLAIEETDWRQALDIAEAHPEQVRTWVRSTGTENTTFTWSMWRRLPIHEACRRQAPAWLISSLFSTFPESAYLATQFGELPLHLVVDSGAAPEVVNLVLVANWGGVVARDNSGRAPTDIVAQGELRLLDEHRFVYESLMRCHKTYTDMQKNAHDKQTDIKRKHNGQITTLHRQHQEALKKEYEKQQVLLMDLEARELEIEQMKKIDAAKDQLLLEADSETKSWKGEVEALTAVISKLRDDVFQEKKNVSFLKQSIKERDADIASRDEFIECLSGDLRAISGIHEHDIVESVRVTEKAMRAMVSSQIALQKQLSEKASRIKSLLSFRGIGSLPTPTSHAINTDQEAKEPFPDEQPADSGEVAAALRAAAMAALKPSLTSQEG